MVEKNSSSSPGGRNKYCCVPLCQSSFYDNQLNRTGISFFSFPLEAKVKNRWLLAIKRQEHRDGFVVTEYTKVCEQHFLPEEIKTHFSGRKDLKDKTTVPSNFSWNKSASTFGRKSPKKKCLHVSFKQKENANPEPESSYLSVQFVDQDNTRPKMICEDCAHLRQVVEKLNVKISDLIKQKSDGEKENNELIVEIEKLKKKQFDSNNIREQEDVFKSFTGLHPVKFDILLKCLNPGENAGNLKYHEASKVSDEADKCKFAE